MMQLKQLLLAEYGSFADKRIKKIEKGQSFIIDDRKDSDIGADRKLLSYFCSIFANVAGDNRIELTLSNNVPNGADVAKWLKKNNLRISDGLNPRLSIALTPENYEILGPLADAVESIVKPNARRYDVPSYKFVCPRVAKSLRRLKGALDRAWPGGKRIGFGL